jgi:hypothetical protein
VLEPLGRVGVDEMVPATSNDAAATASATASAASVPVKKLLLSLLLLQLLLHSHADPNFIQAQFTHFNLCFLKNPCISAAAMRTVALSITFMLIAVRSAVGFEFARRLQLRSLFTLRVRSAASMRKQHESLSALLLVRSVVSMRSQLTDLERRREDEGADFAHYRYPRLVYHADHDSLAQLSELYFRSIKRGGCVLDLCSSWVSHLPKELQLAHVEGQGMSVAELRCNPMLDNYFAQDLNHESALALASDSFDSVLMCCGIQVSTRNIA